MAITANGTWRLADHVLGFDVQHSLLWAEGHPGGAGRLALPAELAHAERSLRDLVNLHGIELRDPANVSRLDSTVTQRFPRQSEGMAVLLGMAALEMPRLKPIVYGRPPETVALSYVRGRGRVLARVYDWGLSRGLPAERGHYVRAEDQRRYQKPELRLQAEAYDRERVRNTFRHRFEPVWQASRGLVVAGLPVIARKLGAELEAGELSRDDFDRAWGMIGAELYKPRARPKRNGKLLGIGRATYYRRRRLVRELGIVPALELGEVVEVDLASVFERALDSGHWGEG